VPLTFDGDQFSIDHFVQARVVGSGADVVTEEAFVVVPGEVEHRPAGLPEPFVAPPLEMFGKEELRHLLTTPPGAALWAVIPISVFAVGFFGGIVLGAVLTVCLALAWNAYRDRLFDYILGPVEVETTRTIVSPGESFEVSLHFTPKKAYFPNEVRIRLTGEEIAENEQATSWLTQRNRFHDQTHRFPDPHEVVTGHPVSHQLVVVIPKTTAWSFEGQHNRVQWTAIVMIGLLGFPRWELRIPLTVVPGSTGAIDTGGSVEPAQLPAAMPSPTPAVTPLEHAGPSPHIPDAFEAESGAIAQADLDDQAPARFQTLHGPLDHVATLPRSGTGRADLVAEHIGTTFEADIEIKRVVRSMRSTLPDGYRDGQEVIGSIIPTEHEAQVFLLETSTERIADAKRGEQRRLTVTPSGWDTLYQRLILLEARDSDLG